MRRDEHPTAVLAVVSPLGFQSEREREGGREKVREGERGERQGGRTSFRGYITVS